jgi:hypothetical protein
MTPEQYQKIVDEWERRKAALPAWVRALEGPAGKARRLWMEDDCTPGTPGHEGLREAYGRLFQVPFAASAAVDTCDGGDGDWLLMPGGEVVWSSYPGGSEIYGPDPEVKP